MLLQYLLLLLLLEKKIIAFHPKCFQKTSWRLCKDVNDDEAELLATFPEAARIHLLEKEQYLRERENALWHQENSSSAMWNLKINSKSLELKRLELELAMEIAQNLKLLGCLNLHQVILEVEKDPPIWYLKRKYRSEKKGKSLSRKDLWQRILSEEFAKFEFNKLRSLGEEGISVEGIIDDLFRSTSKDSNVGQIDKVLIDSSILEPDQVKVAEALCEILPVDYMTVREERMS